MRGRLILVAAALVAACSSGGDDQAAPERSSTTTTSTSSRTTSSTTTTTSSTTVVAPAPATTASPGCPAVPARRQPTADRPAYTIRADVQPAAGAVTGDVTVRFTPDVATDRLVFRLWPNGPKLAGAGARLDVGPVSIDGGTAAPGDIPDPTTLVVPLGRTVEAGRDVTASLPWRLTLPASGAGGDRIARTGDTVRLGSFFPVLGWESGHGWTTEPPTNLFAEASTAPTADFDLTVTAPPDLTVFASGTSDRPGHWTAKAMRDIAVTTGRFRTETATANAPRPVPVTVAVESGIGDDTRGYLTPVVRALEDLARRFGPYPWPSYTVVVTPGLRGGIEYPTLVHQGPGTQGRTTPHEAAHEWFYGLVGNDQGRDPWLDEGLASYGEARVLGNLGSFMARAIPADAAGRTGAPMTYWAAHGGSYYPGVYVQGTQALAALGPPDAVDCALRHYVANNAFAIARPDDLVAALEVVFPDARAVLRRYGAVG